MSKLLQIPLPAGVTITGVRVVPDQAHEGITIAQNDSIGYYADFNLADPLHVFTLPDGIVLSTGSFVAGGNQAKFCNDETGFKSAELSLRLQVHRVQ